MVRRLHIKFLAGDRRRCEFTVDPLGGALFAVRGGDRELQQVASEPVHAQDPALLPRARSYGIGSAGRQGGSVSMSYPVLSPARYTAWAIKVEAILDSQGLWEAV